MIEQFALDIGNKQTKMVSEKTSDVFPSYYLLKQDLGSSLTLIGQQRLIDSYESNIDPDFTYAWGKEIAQVSTDKYIDTISFDNRYRTNEFKLLVDFSLANLAKDYPAAKMSILECTVATGVPSSDYHDEAIRDIITAIKGDHNVRLNGESLNIRVKEVFVIQQPIGTIYNELLDSNGYIENESFLDENVVVVDIGGGTLLIDTLKSLNLDEKQSGQRDNGAYDLFERIKNLAKQKGIRGLTEYKIEQIVRRGNSESGYSYQPNKNECIDLTEIILTAQKIYTREVINTINTTLKDKSQIDTALFTGGGPNVLNSDELKQVFKNSYLVEDSETATVRGYFKYLRALQQQQESDAAE
ncbi:plasmid segregation protein ParM [Amphibacillus marinus]|uniref:Plasmid segregation protein ParM n=1 Tax=Amphibacillus marinus TaxID=872970 RepID=A0A1H8SQ26_9BACI|nr:plasmid segregation protein ParM domain-containing protein [Amphibacillus marinus]SEO80636.1 plasmid segregation protein ParM [Amphibacillus marinus]